MATDTQTAPVAETTTPATETPVKKAPPLISSPLVIAKNGVSLTFVPDNASRGRNVGAAQIVPSTDPNVNPPGSFFTWLGVDIVASVIADHVRGEASKCVNACTTETFEEQVPKNADGSPKLDPNGKELPAVKVKTSSVFDLDKFQKVLPVLVSSTDTNKELEAKNADLFKQAMEQIKVGTPDSVAKVAALLQEMQSNTVIIDVRKEM